MLEKPGIHMNGNVKCNEGCDRSLTCWVEDDMREMSFTGNEIVVETCPVGHDIILQVSLVG